MSLHQIAHHVQSAGRGNDKILVHMTPGEVGGLQAIAKAHGGSLTINPQTGLPEAGFLEAILPMAAGFFLGPAGIGIAQSALGAGAIVGGVTAAATGSLSKGLMAGFGAYGGFGLGEGLAAAGANTLGAGGANAGTTAANLGQQTFNAVGPSVELSAPLGSTAAETATKAAADAAVKSGGYSGIQPFANADIMAANPYGLPPPPLPTYTGSVSAPHIAGEAMSSATVNPTNLTINGMPQAAVTNVPTTPIVDASKFNPNAYNEPLTNNIDQIMSKGTPASYGDKVSAGFKDVTSSGDKAWQFVKGHPMPFITAGLGLAQDVMGNKSGAAAPSSGPSYLRPYEFSTEQDPNAYLASNSTAERRYFKEPRYKAKPIERLAASGGLMRMAEGGATLALPDRPPVEQASDEQAIGQNMSFPMANQRPPAYSSPTNRPMMHEVVDPSGGPEVDPYTGDPMFASGGLARFALGGAAAARAEPTTETKYAYNPETMQYTQTTTSTPAANGLMGNPLIAGVFGLAPYMRTMGGGYAMNGTQGMGGFNAMGLMDKLNAQQQAPQPTTTTETSGGVAAPYIPEGQAQAQPQMQAANPIAPNINVPQYQTPEQQLGLTDFYSMMDQQLAKKGAQMQGLAGGGMAGNSHLGGYSDGGRLLKGPGDGVSDSIPAVIGRRQPARLADGEFVVPARIVSEIGNGSTEAGARKLYAMMDRVQKARRKTVGKGKVAVNSKSERFLPA